MLYVMIVSFGKGKLHQRFVVKVFTENFFSLLPFRLASLCFSCVSSLCWCRVLRSTSSVRLSIQTIRRYLSFAIDEISVNSKTRHEKRRRENSREAKKLHFDGWFRYFLYKPLPEDSIVITVKLWFRFTFVRFSFLFIPPSTPRLTPTTTVPPINFSNKTGAEESVELKRIKSCWFIFGEPGNRIWDTICYLFSLSTSAERKFLLNNLPLTLIPYTSFHCKILQSPAFVPNFLHFFNSKVSHRKICSTRLSSQFVYLYKISPK